jgi:hypothetical protein
MFSSFLCGHPPVSLKYLHVALIAKRRRCWMRAVLKALLRDRRAFTQVVAGLISVVVVIAMGAIIIAMLTSALGQFQLSEQAQATVNNLFNMTWVAYGLLVVVPIIAVAAVILSMLQGGRGRR